MFSENQLLITDQQEKPGRNKESHAVNSYNQIGKIGIQNKSRKRISTDSMKNSIQNPQGFKGMNNNLKQSSSMLRRNSQKTENDDKNMNIINIDD